MKSSFFKNYVAAVTFSLIAHLFFGTIAEGALLLSQLFKSEEPTFYFTSPEPKDLPLKKRKMLTQPKAVPNQAPTDKHVDPPKSLQPKIKEIKKEVNQFQKSQKQINQRIKKFKNTLVEKQVSSVNMKIYHLEKLPLEFRGETLPLYLKKMRLKISKKWLYILESFKCDSCQASVEFQVNSKGDIFNSELLKSNAPQLFNRACLEAVKSASPLGPLVFLENNSGSDNFITVSLTFYFEGKNTLNENIIKSIERN